MIDRCVLHRKCTTQSLKCPMETILAVEKSFGVHCSTGTISVATPQGQGYLHETEYANW